MASCGLICKRAFSSYKQLWSNAFNHVTVVGGGLMGSGIAQVTAQSGIDVTIIEVNEEAVKKANANIKSSVQRVAKKLFPNNPEDAEKYISESTGRLNLSLDLREAVGKSDLVIEAIVENMAAKHQLFSNIDKMAPEHTIFASNTSSLSISEIAAVTSRTDRFAGLHFFNPVPVMKLLEIVRTNDTSDETYQKLMAWGKAIGKTPITCKDTPGFVVNRLLIPYLAEAARMLERGDATAKDIDIAMKLGAGYPMGPLELLDYVGLDTTKFILDGWHSKAPDNPSFKPIEVIDKLVSEGKLGKKTGEGFYSYKKNLVTVFLHSPYIEPFLTEKVPIESNSEKVHLIQASSPEKPLKKKQTIKLKFDKMKREKNSEENFLAPWPKFERAKRAKDLQKSRRAAELIKYEKEKAFTSTALATRPFEHQVHRSPAKSMDTTKNLEDLIELERNRILRFIQKASN